MNYKFKKGFTLIELLVVIAIIGILSGFVIISMNGAINAANDARKKTNLDTIKKAAVMLSVTNGSYPVETGCTIGSCSALDPLIEEYIPSVVDGAYTYQSDGASFTLSSVLSSGYSYQFDSSTNTYSTNNPINGTCGSSNGVSSGSAPTTNLCTLGSASTVTGSGPWNWTCIGSGGGTTASCAASLSVAGSCGTKNGKYADIAPEGTAACTIGTVTGMTGSYSWTCVNDGLSSPTCATVAATYAQQEFKNVGTNNWTVPAGVNSIHYLIVAGGGFAGGVNLGGGGGAGGLLYNASYSVTPGASIPVVVGAGSTAVSVRGGDSSFNNIVATGGGWGGVHSNGPDAGSGGSGGGGSYVNTTAGAGIAGQGYAGGSGGYPTNGGGGGAGGAGISSPTGTGGIGRDFSAIFGTAVGDAGWFAGGGAGACWASPCPLGGRGGGGKAGTNTGGCGINCTAYPTGNMCGTPGMANTGGGAGSGYGGVVGGSGIVIVKYVNNY